MIRNVPNDYSREKLMAELDELGMTGKYDFVYLPIDTLTNFNVGYAFVNFRMASFASEAMTTLGRYTFRRGHIRRKAVVSYAHLQGLKKNLAHLSRTQTRHSRNAWLDPFKLCPPPPCAT